MYVECWTLTKDIERRFEAAMRISWTEKKSNDEVIEMAGGGYKRSLLKTIRKRQLESTLFWAYKQSRWTRKESIEWKDLWYQKQRKTMHKIHRQSE